MDFRAIIGFIAIAFISSLFNKNKGSAKPTTKTDSRPASQEPQPTINRIPNTNENRRKDYSGGLGELFREMRTEFEKTFGETQKKRTHTTGKQNIKNESAITKEQKMQKVHELDSKPIKETIKVTGSVYEGEIGKEPATIEFDRKSIIQGVIMSEILQKPKSLRR